MTLPEPSNTSEQPAQPTPDIQFGEEMIVEEAGFSFKPIVGFELEVDDSVYMYSDDGNLEIVMIGGELQNDTSIADLNDELAADFMINFDQFELVEAGKESVQGITGFLNRIRFINAEEEGLGQALICSPHINQFFFLLVISSADYWDQIGQKAFTLLKNQIHFHAKFTPTAAVIEDDVHPDLTIETFESIQADEDLIITIEKGDVFLLLAARASTAKDEISITDINAPGDQSIYHYDPISGDFYSTIAKGPLTSTDGEVCVALPCADQSSLQSGDYRFTFSTSSGLPLGEIQVIIRHTRALDLQNIDLNLWMALENERFNDLHYLAQFEAHLRAALVEHLQPINLVPGRIEYYHPAPDELGTFACINLDTDLADISYMIAESVENTRALNIGLVDRFTQGDPPIDAEVSAISCGSPGMILAPVSPHACILVNYSAFEENYAALAQALVEQLIVFSGVDEHCAQPDQPQDLSQEIEWRLLRHPIFYAAN
ncbi:MAG: hypothetical protein K0B06_02675 [Brevefilum sp.]|nr:hypothetical protein [Brevefilum sp.]